MLKRGAIAVISTVSPLAFAWSGYGLVDRAWSHDGSHFIQTDLTDNPCGTAGKFWWEVSDPDAKDMFALALTALATDKQISVAYPSTPNCLYGGALVTAMVIAR